MRFGKLLFMKACSIPSIGQRALLDILYCGCSEVWAAVPHGHCGWHGASAFHGRPAWGSEGRKCAPKERDGVQLRSARLCVQAGRLRAVPRHGTQLHPRLHRHLWHCCVSALSSYLHEVLTCHAVPVFKATHSMQSPACRAPGGCEAAGCAAWLQPPDCRRKLLSAKLHARVHDHAPKNKHAGGVL